MIKKEDGFTIIEIVVVVAILSVSLLTIAGIFVYNTQATEESERVSKSLAFGKRITEDVRSVTISMVNDEGYDKVDYSDATDSGAFSPTHIYSRFSAYYSNFDNITASKDSDDDGQISNDFENLADQLGISGSDKVYIKQDDMMAVVEVNNYKKRASDGDLVKDSNGNEIVVREIKKVDIEIKWLDRSNDVQQQELSTLITRR